MASGQGPSGESIFRMGDDEPTAEMEVPVQTSNGASDRAAELFMESLAEREQLASDRLREDIRTLKRHVNFLFAASMGSAMTALGLCVFGVVMIVNGAAPAAALSEAMSILTGVGTAGLKSMSEDLRVRRDQLVEEERESARIMRAVGLTQMIPDAVQRNAQIADLAARMVDRLDSVPASRSAKRAERRRRRNPVLLEEEGSS